VNTFLRGSTRFDNTKNKAGEPPVNGIHLRQKQPFSGPSGSSPAIYIQEKLASPEHGKEFPIEIRFTLPAYFFNISNKP